MVSITELDKFVGKFKCLLECGSDAKLIEDAVEAWPKSAYMWLSCLKLSQTMPVKKNHKEGFWTPPFKSV